MASGGVRLARGWSGAFAATLAAALFHVMAGGNTPGLPVFLLSLALSGLVCTLLAGRVLSLWRMSAAVILSQGLFHIFFSTDATMATSIPLRGPDAIHALHGMAGMHGMSGMSGMGMDASWAAPTPMNHDSPAMWLGHATAAVLTIAIMRHGEVAAVRLIRALRLRVRRFLSPAQPLPMAPLHRVAAGAWPALSRPNLGIPLLAMRHRGPPLLPVAL